MVPSRLAPFRALPEQLARILIGLSGSGPSGGARRRSPANPRCVASRPRKARLGWAHPLHPRCRWEQPRLAARPSTARAAAVRRRNNTRPRAVFGRCIETERARRVLRASHSRDSRPHEASFITGMDSNRFAPVGSHGDRRWLWRHSLGAASSRLDPHGGGIPTRDAQQQRGGSVASPGRIERDYTSDVPDESRLATRGLIHGSRAIVSACDPSRRWT